MNTNDLLTELDATTNDWLQTLSSFTQEEINAIPFEGSWTPGQVADHIFLSASGVLQGLNGPVKPTERNVEQHVALLRKIFLDFNTKMKSPDFVLPSNKMLNSEALIDGTTTALAGIREVLVTKDLKETCTLFPLPGLGELTRIELINFITVHVIRHTHQLKNIKAKLAEKAVAV